MWNAHLLFRPGLQIHAAALVSAVVLCPAALAAADLPSFDCVLKPSQEVHISTPTPGLIKSVSVDRGSIVHQGDVIAELESEVEKAQVAIAARKSESRAKVDGAAARVAFLVRKRDRNKVLNKSQIVSVGAYDEIETDLALAQQTLEDSRSDLEMATLDLDRAKAVLSQRVIRSPISGVVTERKLSPGEYWTEQQWVVNLANVETLNVEAFVPIALHGALTPDTAATVMPEAPIGGSYKARIDVIDRVYDAASGTFGIRLKLPNAALAIPAGIRCKVQFEGIEANLANALPASLRPRP